MKTDARGRIRFAYKGTRFVLSGAGIRGYRRFISWRGFEREVPENYMDFCQTLSINMADPEFRGKLHEALGELRSYEDDPCRSQGFTKDIFIPKHMRAV